MTIHVISLRTNGISLRTNGISRILVPGNLNGTPVDALPDTGADDCCIDAAFARKENLDILPTNKKRIVLGSGKTIKPVGEVRATWKFRDEHEAHPLVLYVLESLADTNLALGSLFLKATKTFTEHRSRISRCMANATVFPQKPPFKVHLLGGGTDRIRGYLDGIEVCALPDTGSQIMAMSTAMALRQNWKIDTTPENRIRVQYADGSTKLARGLVRGLDWDFGIQGEPPADCGLYGFDDDDDDFNPVHVGAGVGGLSPANYKLDDHPVGFRVQGKSVNCDFYVLDDLPVDVILSADFVLDLGVFTPKYEACFLPAADAAVHGSENGRLGMFCNIRIVKNWFKRAFRRPRSTAHPSASDADLADPLPSVFTQETVMLELHRRKGVDANWANMDQADIEREMDYRRAWEAANGQYWSGRLDPSRQPAAVHHGSSLGHDGLQAGLDGGTPNSLSTSASPRQRSTPGSGASAAIPLVHIQPLPRTSGRRRRGTGSGRVDRILAARGDSVG